MNLLLVHNFYQQPGGEDEVFRTEYDLLRGSGHTVLQYTVHNDACDDMTKLELARSTVWNTQAAGEIRDLVASRQIDIVHFHNTFPLISPAAYSAAREEGAAVVQTLHNFRLLCPNGLFFRDGKPCEECLGKTPPWPAVAHGCYREDRKATAVIAAALTIHRMRRTWHDDIDALIATTNFAREKFVQSGHPAHKITVKPNFLHPDPGVGPGDGDYALFVGRLSHEKGLKTLLDAWTHYGIPLKLKIIGDGPLADQLKASMALANCEWLGDSPVQKHGIPAESKNPSRRIQWLGRRPLEEVYHHIGAAKMLIFPSECYETFGRVAIEAFAKGTPVVASNHGAPADVVAHDRTGLLFTPGDAEDLALKVQTLLASPATLARMRGVCRAEFDAKYTGRRAYEQLMAIYQRALEARHPIPAGAFYVPKAS